MEGGSYREGAQERARDEFFSEAQELVDALTRDLLALDEAKRRGALRPELLNDVFRAVHTLKGLSSLFGAVVLSALSHELENLLDDLRMGRTELDDGVLDLLFKAVEAYGRILASEKQRGESGGDASAEHAHDEVNELLAELAALATQKGRPAEVLAQYAIDPAMLGVLTEYEEHRLRSAVESGLRLVRLFVRFPLSSIDASFDTLKDSLRAHGEIITYLPAGDDDGGAEERPVDAIDLEVIVASSRSVDELRVAVAAQTSRLDEIPRRVGRAGQKPSVPVEAESRPQVGLPDLSYAQEPSISDLSIEDMASVVGLPPEMQQALGLLPAQVELPAGASPGGASTRQISLRSVSQTVRVDIRKLDRLMNAVGELAIVRGSVQRLADTLRLGHDGAPATASSRRLGAELLRVHRMFERRLAELQQGVLDVRMVPLAQVFDKVARIVRQLSREHGKPTNFVVTGADTEIDKLIVEELSDPLLHMVRNAIDHGIEAQAEREREGKPATGTLALNAFQKGNHVVIEVEDDGAGIDPQALIRRAKARGLLTELEAQEMSAKEALALVFLPGFSTKDRVTDLSGRGVGMDVVKTNIAKIGGTVEVQSGLRIGTKVVVTLPVTLAIISVLAMGVAGYTYCMPLASMEEALALDPSQVRSMLGREVLSQRGASIPLVRLSELFVSHAHEVLDAPAAPRTLDKYVVITSIGNRRVGFVVDQIFGQQDIVLKALGPSLAGVPGFSGATELGDQRVALVLDVAALHEEVYGQSAERAKQLEAV